LRSAIQYRNEDAVIALRNEENRLRTTSPSTLTSRDYRAVDAMLSTIVEALSARRARLENAATMARTLYDNVPTATRYRNAAEHIGSEFDAFEQRLAGGGLLLREAERFVDRVAEHVGWSQVGSLVIEGTFPGEPRSIAEALQVVRTAARFATVD